jgi:hypothetical protein
VSTAPQPSPVTLWSGITVNSDDPEVVGAIDRFYGNGYLEEIGAKNPDLAGGHRYELLAPDRHRGFGAKYLTAFDLPDERAAQRCAERADLLSVPSAPPAWQAGADTSWSLLYRYLNETAPALNRPFAIYMVGVDPPPGLDASGMEEFNEFYTNVHVPEVARRRRSLRASRYELLKELLVPPEGRPQFLAIYEVDEKGASVTRHIGGGYTRGPEVWRKHKTPWRLWYRLLPESGSA